MGVKGLNLKRHDSFPKGNLEKKRLPPRRNAGFFDASKGANNSGKNGITVSSIKQRSLHLGLPLIQSFS